MKDDNKTTKVATASEPSCNDGGGDDALLPHCSGKAPNEKSLPYSKVVVHPLVLLSVVDHLDRTLKLQRVKRVVGVLLGSKKPSDGLDVANSFAVPFDEDNDVCFFDEDYLESMYRMFHKVAARERVVGWYHTGPSLYANDIEINAFLKKYTADPILLIVNPSAKFSHPARAYVEVEETHSDGSPPVKTFEHLACEVGAEEAEEVGVEHLLRDIKDQSAGTLSQQITNQLYGLRGLHSHVQHIGKYLRLVADGALPINHHIIYMLQDVRNVLPDVSEKQFVRAASVNMNDQKLCMYIGTLIRAVIGMHNLIDNKMALRAHEKRHDEQIMTAILAAQHKNDDSDAKKPDAKPDDAKTA